MRSGFLEGFREMKMEIGGLVWWGCGPGKRRGKREVQLRKEREGSGDGARSGRFIGVSSE